MISANDISNHISELPDPVFNPATGLNLNDFNRDSDRPPEPAWTPEPVIGPEVSRHSDGGGQRSVQEPREASRQQDLQLLIPPSKNLAVVI